MKLYIVLAIILSVHLQARIGESKQLLVVTTDDWNSSSGKMQRYQRDRNQWQMMGKPIEIKLGRNGLGWGIGLHHIPKNAPYIKKEGDGRSPAGIFKLKQAFGYAPFKIAYPYHVYQESDHCVDDVHSLYYNKIIDTTKVVSDDHSHELMKFSENYYAYGIVVDHNGIAQGERPVKGAGSCIFIHIKNIPTAGCTVMFESEMKKVLQWLDPDAEPLLIQGTKKVVDDLWKEVDGHNEFTR
jgi:D-alanyl-D-alanine dipeptidase